MLNFKTFSLVAFFAIATVGEALAEKHCWCQWRKDNKDGAQLHSYSGMPGPWKDIAMGKEKECASACSAKATPDFNKQFLADAACAAGVGDGQVVRAYSKVGASGNNDPDATSPKLINKAAVYNCPQGGSLSNGQCVAYAQISLKCPAGWAANQTNVDGGVTADGLCKKGVATCTGTLPSNGTQIGNPGSQWGFVWGNAIIQFGNASNGGAAVQSCPDGYSIVSGPQGPLFGAFNNAGPKCKKSYAAVLVSPKMCKFQ